MAVTAATVEPTALFVLSRNAESRHAYGVRPYLARHVDEGGEVGGEHVCQGACHAGLLCTALGPCALQNLG